MREFSAKQLHENPSEVYRAANREPVVITHRHHGEMILCSAEDFINAGLIIVKDNTHNHKTTAKETGATE